MNNLGDLYNTLERFNDAEPLLRDLVNRARRTLPEGHWFLGSFLTKHGVSLTGLGAYDQAERALLEAHDIVSDTFGPNHHRTIAAKQALVNLYEATGKPHEAVAWHPQAPQPE